MSKNVAITEGELYSKIYEIRGQRVMLDRDLAEIYGYETKTLNQQVKNNKEKFEGEEFMFRLTEDELNGILSYRNYNLNEEESLRCNFCTLNENEPLRSKNLTLKNDNRGGDEALRSKNLTLKNGRGEHSKYLPYAFTEQGIYMLMTVLKGELATKQSRLLVMTFKAMKDYIVENKMLIDYRDNLNIVDKIYKNSDEIKKIDARVSELADEMNEVVKRTEISPVFLDFAKTIEDKEFLLFDGEAIRAKEAYMEIYKKAKKKIYIVDNYVDIRTLHLLQSAKQNLEIIFFTDNVGRYLRVNDLKDFRKERPDLKIKFIKTMGAVHDRFIILDEKKVYQAGGSSKDAGCKMTSIHEISDEFITQSLLNELGKMKQNPELILK